MTALIWNSENMFPLSSFPVWLKKKNRNIECVCVYIYPSVISSENLWYNWSFRLIDFNLHRLFSVPNLYFCKPLLTDLHFLSILACTIVAAKFDICTLTVDGTCCCVKLAALFYWDIYLTTLFIDLKENPVGSWIRSEVSFSRTGLQDKQEAVYWMCFSF